MAEEAQGAKKKRRGVKIGIIVAICALVALGGVGAATAPSWANFGEAKNSSDSSAASSTGQAAATSSATQSSANAAPVNWTVAPLDGAKAVNPASEPSVKVDGAKLQDVVLTNTVDGSTVAGSLSADGASWTATDPLAFNGNYTFEFTALNSANQQIKQSSSFATVISANEANAAVYPANGAKVGVGQPIQITFSEPVVNKAAMEKNIQISTSSNQPGAFHWYSDSMVRYRPQDFWNANTTISIKMNLLGKDFGNGQIGNANTVSSFAVGDKKVIKADGNTHQAQVFINDQLVRTMPTTLGDANFPSASGWQVMMDKQKRALFKAASIGLKPGAPGDYGEVWVNNAIRLTLSGQFMHEATPTGMSVLGLENASHGCIGLSADDSQYVWDNFGTGDLVFVSNSGNTVAPPTDGFGDWNIPWDQWAN